MSIDLNWETVTGGPDGQELAHQIRDFIHARFQTVPLPRFIKSVTVHDFEFGSIPPEIELKDITDPLPDFYEVDEDDPNDEDGSDLDEDDGADQFPDGLRAAAERRRRIDAETDAGLSRSGRPGANVRPHLSLTGGGHAKSSTQINDIGSPLLRVATPGIPGGTSNLHYFHSHFGTALSGSQTPLAAVAGAHHLSNAWLDSHHGNSASTPNLRQQYGRTVGETGGYQPGHSRNPSRDSISIMDFNPNPTTNIGGLAAVASPSTPTSPVGAAAGLGIFGTNVHHTLREKHSVSTLAPTSAGTSRPPTRDAASVLAGSTIAEDGNSSSNRNRNRNGDGDESRESSETAQRRFREPRVEDMQAVFRIKYAGDIKLLLTADILLDYPMPSFVGIPVRLSITGLTFDGVGVLANIRKRVHFCFLSPEDAVAAVGGEENLDKEDGTGIGGVGSGAAAASSSSFSTGTKIGGLLQEIRVESEIGQRESGKQSLKNVGKVERFVLEQVRRIFEEELVYPSFWTFLV
ncbi:hypothetical protein B0H66DRAFT_28965 [Apodospora peruviana]|uniref:Mitochondrial distribution and morphology protein 12 n=1 Tax=Apodospora peruviana TaxID=516989 RepID=A0AAE0MEF9_9PEZI|nr:hypothetical protein B0H66DRAFT_28965 [Apodospora peruviana]